MADGKLLVKLSQIHDINGYYAQGMAMLKPDGGRDSSFYTGLWYDQNCWKVDSAVRRIYTGKTYWGNASDFYIARYTLSGALDTAFTNNVWNSGLFPHMWDNTPHRIEVNALAPTPEGKIYYGGIDDVWDTLQPSSNRYASIFGRVNFDGTVDTGFPSNGFGGGIPKITDFLLQKDNSIIVVGTFTSYQGDSVPGICRILANGVLDTTFQAGSGLDSVLTRSYNDRGITLKLIPAPNHSAYIYGDYKGYNGSGIPYLNRISIKPRSTITSTPAPQPSIQPFTLVPNPATGRLTITARGYSGPVTIYNALGRMVQQLTMRNGSVTTDVSGITPGMYVVRCGTRSARLMRN